MKKNWKSIMGYIILAALLFILAGSFLIYRIRYEEATVIDLITMSFQNMAETFLFNPILVLEDVAEWTKEIPAFQNTFYSWFIPLFQIVAALTPFIEVIFVFSFFDSFLHMVTKLTTKGRRVLVVGYNDRVRSLLKNGTENQKIYLWTEKLLSEEEIRELAIQRITADTNETPLGIRTNPEKQRKQFDNYLSRNGITDVILMLDTDTANIEYYMVLSQCETCRKNTVHFFVNIEEFGARVMLQEYFDQKLTEQKKNKKDPLIMDLKIFNYAEIQAHVLFKVLPVHKGTDKASGYDVHMLIVGNNAMSEAMVIHAMNQAVITEKNNILIDVVGANIETLKKKLCDRFNSSYVVNSGNSFAIGDGRADGTLKICLLEGDPRSDETIKMIERRNTSRAYTYFAGCMDHEDDNLYIFNKLKGILGKIPMALSIPYIYEMKDYLKSLKQIDGVFLTGSENEYLRFENIISDDEENKAREFNQIYGNLNPGTPSYTKDEADRSWNSLLYYKRESNRALYYHQPVKAFICAKYSGFPAIVKAFWDQSFKDEYIEGRKHYSNKLLSNAPEELDSFARTEHRRFCYFYASEGWGFTEGEKDEPGRLHDCLCTWERLTANQNTRKTIAYDVTSTKNIAKML